MLATLVPVCVNSEKISSEFVYAESNHIKIIGQAKNLDLDQTKDLLMEKGSDYSVFCFDYKNDEIILIKTNKETNLYQSPFIYVAQRNNAIEALYLPVPMAIELSDDLAATFPSDFQLVHFYSVGRCGSTLLCKAMDATENCQSLSEPDLFTNLTHFTMKQSNLTLAEHRTKLVSIFRAGLILLIHFCLSNKPNKKVLFMKYRSNCIPAAEPIQLAYPSAKTIFLHRDALSHNESFTRAFITNHYWKYWLYTTLRIDQPSWTFTKSMVESGWIDMDDLLNNIFEYPGHHGYIWISFCFWISSMETAARLRQKNPQDFFHFITDYKSLLKNKQECIKNLFNALEIRFQHEDLEAIERVFTIDSQKGTGIQSNTMGKSSDKWYGDWERRLISELLKHHNGVANRIDYDFES